MEKRTLSIVFASVIAAAAVPFATADADYEAPRNSFGQPDLGGIWSNATTTRFERPDRFGNQLVLTEEQAAQVQGAAEAYREAGNKPTDPDAGVPDDGNTSAGYNRFWTDPGTQVMRVGGEPRSSMITTTPDGKVPPRKADAPPYTPRPFLLSKDKDGNPVDPSDNPESRGISERCLFMPTSAGPVMRPVLYNNNYVLTQGRDHVAITVEMIHDTRIIRLGDEHRNNGVRKWMGDSIGRYEGDTLVVETIDYHPDQTFFGASDQLKVIERFTRVSEDRLLYQFTIEDPQVWDQPWGGEYEFWASPGFYEYACHEGNIGLQGILAGARREEAEGEKK
ncbi:hypothetical protein ACXYTJ_07895 [Gilvimarinus sp. F26214L]|uniref:hypothetical protein n=1 Tax=Gilvimarinus sp. DZF01 TaxID=3461371 RepID=UPI00404541E5